MHITNCGIDAVEIERFKHWHMYKKEILLKIFTQQELAYIFACPQKSAERFATRFAVKEAVYKGISSFITDSFFATARHIEMTKLESGKLACHITWQKLHKKTNNVPHEILVSVTHTQTMAIAVVMIQ